MTPLATRPFLFVPLLLTIQETMEEKISKPSTCRYYSRESIVSDVDYAPLLTSLLIGPCALEYTKVKSCYQQW